VRPLAHHQEPVDLFWASLTGSTYGIIEWGAPMGDLRIHLYAGLRGDLLEENGASAHGRALRARFHATTMTAHPTPEGTTDP
jgi:hypothetical protein